MPRDRAPRSAADPVRVDPASRPGDVRDEAVAAVVDLLVERVVGEAEDVVPALGSACDLAERIDAAAVPVVLVRLEQGLRVRDRLLPRSFANEASLARCVAGPNGHCG